uniref:RRM domain-containing protein n=1 Tax=Fagus sylvatica TaxID=28930 RepID=A0A2N9FJN4_FAGSY
MGTPALHSRAAAACKLNNGVFRAPIQKAAPPSEFSPADLSFGIGISAIGVFTRLHVLRRNSLRASTRGHAAACVTRPHATSSHHVEKKKEKFGEVLHVAGTRHLPPVSPRFHHISMPHHRHVSRHVIMPHLFFLTRLIVTFSNEKSMRDAIEGMNGHSLERISPSTRQSRGNGGGGGGGGGYSRGGGSKIEEDSLMLPQINQSHGFCSIEF